MMLSIADLTNPVRSPVWWGCFQFTITRHHRDGQVVSMRVLEWSQRVLNAW